ncbi:MAG: NAD(P)/FAD-dependent oxidoreductase [Gammaproteobacteria bacterium]|nr:NAD(P)/FAD-dependent oxidoreductase [Gammaproteobacteria bacterium]
MAGKPDLDVIVVGAGFAGLYMLHRLRGAGFRTRVFEAGDGVGGTWYWNRYPGARCDVESMEYSYSFSDELQQEWEWTERYAGQPEILRYANRVAEKFDLCRDITFGTRVTGAVFDENENRWLVTTDSGESVSAPFVVMATGCLSSTNLPDFESRDSFLGQTYHTGRWPHERVDFTGKRVGIIGTGSSAIQAIPIIAAEAKHLTVFQRTPNYSIPAHNKPLDPAAVQEIKAEYPEFRANNLRMPAGFGSRVHHNDAPALSDEADDRDANYAARWQHGGFTFLGAYNDLLRSREANETAAEFVRQRIRETVSDPRLAELLCPDNVIGCKRPCLDTGYFETYNRANVELVDARERAIECLTANGVVAGGREFEFDCIVFATGFDAMTGALLGVDVRGRDGVTLKQAWDAGPRTYLGLCTVGFPNLFLVTGPGSPSVLTNMIVAIEQHVDWITDCLRDLRREGCGTIEATRQAQDEWVEHVNAVAGLTLYPTCNSWYLGKNIPGKPQVFMPLIGFPPYAQMCAEVAANGYRGFDLS